MLNILGSNTFPTNLTDPPGSRPLTDKGSVLSSQMRPNLKLTIPGSPIAPKNITSPPPNFPFQIDGCGAYTGDLVYVLSKAMAALNPALQDVELGNKSPPYQALFKYGDAYTYVRGVLRGIASVQTKKDLQPDPHFPSAPRFACVTPDTKRFYKFLDIDPYYECNQPESGQAFYWSGSSYIFLCPSFWIGPIEPVGSNCPPIYSNHWQGGGEPLSQYLTYLLIHEMVHFYLGEASLGVFNNPPEIYPINSCVSLDPLNSLHNPQNYQFYVACEYLTIPPNILA